MTSLKPRYLISQAKAESIFSVSFQISLEEDVSSGDCPLGRMLSELKYPWKKESFQRYWVHNIIARKADITNTKYFYERRCQNRPQK